MIVGLCFRSFRLPILCKCRYLSADPFFLGSGLAIVILQVFHSVATDIYSSGFQVFHGVKTNIY